MKNTNLKSVIQTAPAAAVATAATTSALKAQEAYRLIDDELETLAALMAVLTDRLAPNDPEQVDWEKTDVYAWRLAEVIRDRLESSELTLALRELLDLQDLPSKFI